MGTSQLHVWFARTWHFLLALLSICKLVHTKNIVEKLFQLTIMCSQTNDISKYKYTLQYIFYIVNRFGPFSTINSPS